METVSKANAFLTRHRLMDRWALGVMSALILIIGVTILRLTLPRTIKATMW